MSEYKKFGPTTQARENLAIALSQDDDFDVMGDPESDWDQWAETDSGKGHWRRRADRMVKQLQDAGFTVSDDSGLLT